MFKLLKQIILNVIFRLYKLFIFGIFFVNFKISGCFDGNP